MAKALLLNESPHPGGRTAEALNEMVQVFHEEGIETELIQVGDQAVHGCVDCGACAGNGKCRRQNNQLR